MAHQATQVTQPMYIAGPLTDENGIYIEQWKVGIFSCFNDMVPNCCMVFWCPCMSLGQTMSRVSTSGSVYAIVYGILYILTCGFAFTATTFASVLAYVNFDYDEDLYSYFDFRVLYAWPTILTLVPIIFITVLTLVARNTIRNAFKIPGSCCEDCICSFCCGCCVLAQMATHVEAYTPGQCHFNSKKVLPGYSA